MRNLEYKISINIDNTEYTFNKCKILVPISSQKIMRVELRNCDKKFLNKNDKLNFRPGMVITSVNCENYDFYTHCFIVEYNNIDSNEEELKVDIRQLK